MITTIDTQPWSKELVTGNAQFIEIGETVYIVSQVRSDNTFAVFKSGAVPPQPGPGAIFATTATYTFATVSGKNNTSFDPVMSYDGSRYIYIVGTQDNASGEGVDVLLFTYDIQGESASPPNPLKAPIVLTTASYVRDSYDVCILGENQFVAVGVTNPSVIWDTTTVSQPTSISVVGGIITVVAENSFSVGQTVSFSGLQLAGFLNNTSATITSDSATQFMANNLIATESWSIPTSAPFTVTVANVDSFLANSRVVFAASSAILQDVTSTNVFPITSVAIASGVATYTGSFPATLPTGTANITGFTNSGNNGIFSVLSSTTTTLMVTNPNAVAETHAADAAVFASGQYLQSNGTYTFNILDAGTKISIAYTFTPANYTQPSGFYESGYVTWLPGHSLLGFEMDMGSLLTSPPTTPFVSVTVLDSSPFRSGNTFGAVSTYSPDGLSIEVYYESHPKQITYTDQIFNLNLAQYTFSPPMWNLPATTLKTFTGRYADARLTVIPNGGSRTLLQQYYSQMVHQNALVGNLLLGYLDPTTSPPTWTFHVQQGSTGTSYIQGTLSISNTTTSPPALQAFVSYIAEPVYDVRGAWSPEVKSYGTSDRLSYNSTPGLDTGWADYIPNVAVTYAYKGVWNGNQSYNAADVVKVTLPTLPVSYGYYTAKNNVPVSSLSPNLDTANWAATLTPNIDTRFSLAPTAWPLHTNSLDVTSFNMTDIPGFYNSKNFTWLRGSKSALDALSKWGVVGEQVGQTTGATYVSAFDVPPVVSLTPHGFTTIVERGTPTLLDASGTNDRDTDPVRFTWTMNSTNSNIHLTPSVSGTTATLLIDRTIGGASFTYPLLVGVVAVDYSGSNPLHPPTPITNIAVSAGVATIETSSPVDYSAGESVFLYNIGTATFLNDRVGVVQAPATGDVFSVTFTDGLPTPNYTSASDTGSAIANQQFAFVAINIPFNAAPTIDFTHDRLTGHVVTLPIQANRNSLVTINPTYTGATDPDDATTYTWVQTSGTTIPNSQIVSGSSSASLAFETNGVLIQGDTLVWQLTVNDGVNAPVTSSVTVDVAAYPFDFPDTRRLTRAVWAGDIEDRNTVQTWTPLSVSTIYTNFQSIKRTSVLPPNGSATVVAGNDRYILISSGSVCVYGGTNPNMLLLRKLFPPVNYTLSPPVSFPIMDAVHTEDDWTFVLDSAGNLYRYSTAPLINTDFPDTTINLSALVSMSFNKVFTTVSFNNVRVVILTGPDGCLLLQLRNSNLEIQGFFELSVQSGLLYGVDNVQFVRASNVEALNKGQILLGSIAPIVASITSINITNNAVTVVADNSFVSGEIVTFANLTQATFLNAVIAPIVSASPTQFVFSYEFGNYPTTAEGADATATTGGKTYETLIDLSQGQIIGTWDASKLRNQFVTTGEILFASDNTYSGRPTAPVLGTPVGTSTGSGTTNVTLTWVASRPDLVQSYTVQSSFDPTFGSTYTTNVINSGYVESITLPYPAGYTLYFRVQASSNDGVSPYSNVQNIST